MKYDVFISYRREGGDKYARTIQQALEKQYRVFLDFDELKDGVFDQRIIDAISESSVFLLILSRGALDRCVNENDWVRQEILQAVKCGCHIVPVTIDNTFEGLPASLPEELRRAVGQHQFSELQMKTLFKASMEQLVRDRIAPYVRREETTAGIEVHIDVDADCDLFRFKTFIRHLKACEDNVIHLSPGTYKLSFVSTDVPEVKVPKVYDLKADKKCDFFEVALKEKVEEVLAKRKAEEEQKRQAALEKLVLTLIEQNQKYGFADKTGKVVIPCQWKDAYSFSGGLAAVQEANGKWGFIDKMGKIVIPCQWIRAFRFSEGLGSVMDASGKWGFIDKTGKMVIPCQWDTVYSFSEGLVPVMDDNGKWGHIDKTGKIVNPCQWNNVYSFHEGLAPVKDAHGNWGYIDNTGKVVIPCQWSQAEPFSEGLAAVQDANWKWGFIDKTGQVVIPCQWWNAYSFSGGVTEVKDDFGIWWIIDKTGKVVSEVSIQD